jgi:hypothetical protein
MSKENIYIITLNDIIKNDVKVVATYNDKLKAISFIMKNVDKIIKDNSECVLRDEDYYIYERSKGWVYNEKNLKYIYKIHEYNKYTNDNLWDKTNLEED